MVFPPKFTKNVCQNLDFLWERAVKTATLTPGLHRKNFPIPALASGPPLVFRLPKFLFSKILVAGFLDLVSLVFQVPRTLGGDTREVVVFLCSLGRGSRRFHTFLVQERFVGVSFLTRLLAFGFTCFREVGEREMELRIL